MAATAASLHLQGFWSGQIQDFGRIRNVFGPNLEFHPAKQIRDEPVHANHVVINQMTFDARGFQTAPGQQSLGKIAKLLNRDSTAALSASPSDTSN